MERGEEPCVCGFLTWQGRGQWALDKDGLAKGGVAELDGARRGVERSNILTSISRKFSGGP